MRCFLRIPGASFRVRLLARDFKVMGLDWTTGFTKSTMREFGVPDLMSIVRRGDGTLFICQDADLKLLEADFRAHDKVDLTLRPVFAHQSVGLRRLPRDDPGSPTAHNSLESGQVRVLNRRPSWKSTFSPLGSRVKLELIDRPRDGSASHRRRAADVATVSDAVARHCPGESELKGEPSDSRLAEANHAAVALLAAMTALVVAGIGFLSRWGFSDNSPLEWAKYVGLSWFLIHFSVLIRTLLGLPRPGDSGSWWNGHANLSLAALGLVAAGGILWDGSTGVGMETSVVRHPAAALFALVGILGFLCGHSSPLCEVSHSAV